MHLYAFTAMSSSKSSTKGGKAYQTSSDLSQDLQFFHISDPAEASRPDNKKRVRSHAARTSHARGRRERAAQREAAPVAFQEQGPYENMYYESQTLHGDTSMELSFPSEGSSSSSAYRYIQPAPSHAVSYSQSSEYATSSPSFPSRLSQWEQFLLDHYTTVLIPSRHSPCDHPHHPIDPDRYRHGMVALWVPFCRTDPGLLHGLYEAACRDLAARAPRSRASGSSRSSRHGGQQEEATMYEQRALQYRGECLRAMYERMPSGVSGQVVTDNAIGLALILAFNECMAGDLDEASNHMAACDHLVDLKGGYQMLGLNGFLAQLIQWFKGELSARVHAASRSKAHGKRKA